jgi:nitrous-oxide reductase
MVSRWWKALGVMAALTALVAALGGGCSGRRGDDPVGQIMRQRNLSERDVRAALRTYMPTGRRDDYYLFASGGHGGNLIVVGLPSMRIVKYVAVFTPEPWQGYGYGDQTNAVLRGGNQDGHELRWGDMHHPALSETNASYDGQFIFVGDKANGRVAVVNLRDFTTTQIVTSSLIRSDHGGAFVTPNTDYIIEGSQYPAPLGGRYADVTRYNEEYRGAAIFWKFDRQAGRIVPEQSFAIELPPYMQDLADAGKLTSDGWAFFNSFNTERSFGGNAEGRPPLESGASRNDMDYLHVINWRRAAEVAASGATETIGGMRVIRLQTAIDQGLLYFVPEPKSPHGVDVTPDGEDIVVGGKLDTHATVYSFAKIRDLIQARRFEGRDPYGVPILPFRESIRGQVEVGLGPLHTQYDNQGNAYTSLFLESKVARWNVRELRLIDKVSVHYNIGHLATAEGDTATPQGNYLVAMNKWALDRFMPVGPLLPQNFQLVDIAGGPMQVLYDMPLPLGEPHYAQIIRADRLHPIDVYSPAGTDPLTHRPDPNAVAGGRERIERRPDGVHVFMTAIRSHFTPDTVRVRQGDRVFLHITNVEQAHDATHGFALASYNINLSLEPGEHANAEFVADTPGVFPMYCTEFCSALHLEMAGYLLVEPADTTAQPAAPTAPPAAAPPAAPPHASRTTATRRM